MFSHNACPNIYTKKLLVLHCDLPKVKQIKIIFQLQELQILLTITEKKKYEMNAMVNVHIIIRHKKIWANIW